MDLDKLIKLAEDPQLTRRDFLKVFYGELAINIFMPKQAEAGERDRYCKIPPPKVGYKEIVKEADFSQVSLASLDSKIPSTVHIGRIQRSMRWGNITRAAEKRYGIPNNYLLGMVCVESEGDPTKPNMLGDGGLGLIHMQPHLATKYGLGLITNSNKIRDFYQGKKIRNAIEEEEGNLKKLIQYDDRFHPIKNIDAAARMLCDFYEKKKSWRDALRCYSGRGSYSDKVIEYSRKMSSPKYMAEVISDFKMRNANASVDGRKITFNRYVKLFARQTRNYGLDAYKKLPKRQVRKI